MNAQAGATRNAGEGAAARGREPGPHALGWAVLLLAAIVALAAGVRTARLNLRPMHGDEAVQAEKFRALWDGGGYRYDPSEYHGPTLPYLTAASAYLQGAGRFADMDAATLRLGCVAAGIAVVWLTWLVRGALGRWPAVAGAALTALSPAMVFYSRYFIHEMLLVAFTFLTLGAAWRWWRSSRIGWALVCGVAAGLMFATKETSVLAFAAMGVAGVVTWLWGRRRGVTRAMPGTGVRRVSGVVAGTAAAVLVAGAPFSSFGTNWHGLVDAVRTFVLWGARGSNGGVAGIHNHPWHWYLDLLSWHPIVHTPQIAGCAVLVLALVGALAIVVARRGAAPGGGDLAALRFLLVYAVVLTVLYSAIPYKTPWCMVSFLHPILLLAGVGVAAVVRRLRGAVRIAGIAGFVAILALLGNECCAANFRFPTKFGNPYAYAQPILDLKRLPRMLDQLARAAPQGYDTRIAVYASLDDTWPLPWYLRRFNRDRLSYRQAPQEAAGDSDAEIILISNAFWPQLERTMGFAEGGRRAAWRSGDYFGMRNDAAIVLCVAPEVWRRYAAEQDATTRAAAAARKQR